MTRTIVIICVDGLDPEYLEACDAPNLMHLGRSGFLRTGQCMMPSVTNVNNVSLVTASYPEVHGISSNYRLVPETGDEIYMESGEYILAETMFQRVQKAGGKSVLVTSKDKLRTLLADGATVAVSSEQPPDWVVEAVGAPPEIYSLEVNGWAIRAATHVMSKLQQGAGFPARGEPVEPHVGRTRFEREGDSADVEVVYISTTDYAMHTYAPDEPQSQEHITILDEAIGELVDAHPDITLLLTADHGMSQKTRMVDLESALAGHGINARAVPIIKDRYVVHHANLGGCIFVYLEAVDGERVGEALKVLRETPGVEDALEREEAAGRFRLHRERIGDIVVTGESDVVFGNPIEVEMPPRLRSHASAHEREIPLLGYNGDFEGFSFEENRDLGRYVFERVLGEG